MKINLNLLIPSIVLAFLPGWIGGLFTFQKISTWYVTLQKPDFNPPNFIFGPVWSTLYLLIGISLYIVWNKKVSGAKVAIKRKALKIFAVQLFLNGLWSIVFFGAEQLLLAIIVIIALWVSIVLSIKYFMKISSVASYLLVPYLLWVSFAAILNVSLYLLNR